MTNEAPGGVVKLRNGAEEAASLVAATMVSIEALLWRDPIAFCDLVAKARDPRHKVWSAEQEQTLRVAGLMDVGNNVHRAIANIVVSAVTGDGLLMKLRDPRAQP